MCMNVHILTHTVVETKNKEVKTNIDKPSQISYCLTYTQIHITRGKRKPK